MLVGVYKEPEQKEEFESLLAELDSLVDTLEIPVIERLLVRVQERNARYFVGTGKAAEIFMRAAPVGVKMRPKLGRRCVSGM